MSWEGYSSVMIIWWIWGDCDVYILRCEEKIWELLFFLYLSILGSWVFVVKYFMEKCLCLFFSQMSDKRRFFFSPLFFRTPCLSYKPQRLFWMFTLIKKKSQEFSYINFITRHVLKIMAYIIYTDHDQLVNP